MMTVEDRSYNYIAFYLTFGNVYCNILIEHTVFDSPGFEPRVRAQVEFVFFFCFFSRLVTLFCLSFTVGSIFY